MTAQALCCSIIIPAYNEEGGIASVILAIKKKMKEVDYRYEIIVVDDGSSDNTAIIARGMEVRVLRHASNRGYGAALKTGIRQARYDIIVITDADGTYPIDMLPILVQAIEEYDMVVGARIGEHVKIPYIRRFVKWILRKIANYLTGTRIPDLNSGFRVFKKKTALKFFNVLPSGFSFTTTITLAMLTNDYQVCYLPINYYERVGISKIRPIHDTSQFLMLIFRTIMYFNPLKIFFPIGGGLLLLALGVFLYSFFWKDRLLDTTVTIISMTAVQVLVIGMLADLINKRNQSSDPD